MYIYNVTINIDESIHHSWLSWMRETHIPNILKTGKFTKALMTQVLLEEDMGGVTYSIQYTATTAKNIENYLKEDEIALQQAFHPFVGKFVSFNTELKIIEEFIA